jgi:hypothetical protein
MHSQLKTLLTLAISANKRYLATVEAVWDQEEHQVSVYNLQTEKRVRSLAVSPSVTQATNIEGVSFRSARIMPDTAVDGCDFVNLHHSERA